LRGFLYISTGSAILEAARFDVFLHEKARFYNQITDEITDEIYR
jgi:hypothetical protein